MPASLSQWYQPRNVLSCPFHFRTSVPAQRPSLDAPSKVSSLSLFSILDSTWLLPSTCCDPKRGSILGLLACCLSLLPYPKVLWGLGPWMSLTTVWRVNKVTRRKTWPMFVERRNRTPDADHHRHGDRQSSRLVRRVPITCRTPNRRFCVCDLV